MKITSIASIASMALIITGLANAADERLLEQGNSIYFCETPEDASGLVKTYSTADDTSVRDYVQSKGEQGCGRFPPRAELKFYILHSTEHGGIVKIRLEDNSEYWIDAQQAKDQIADNDQRQEYNSRQEAARMQKIREDQKELKGNKKNTTEVTAYNNFPNTIEFIKTKSIQRISDCMSLSGEISKYKPSMKDEIFNILATQWALIEHYRGKPAVNLVKQGLQNSYFEITQIGLEQFATRSDCASFNGDVSSWLRSAKR